MKVVFLTCRNARFLPAEFAFYKEGKCWKQTSRLHKYSVTRSPREKLSPEQVRIVRTVLHRVRLVSRVLADWTSGHSILILIEYSLSPFISIFFFIYLLMSNCSNVYISCIYSKPSGVLMLTYPNLYVISSPAWKKVTVELLAWAQSLKNFCPVRQK